MRSRSAGFTLIEAVIATSILVVSIIAILTLAVYSRTASDQSRDSVQVANYMQEGQEAVRIMRDSDWNTIATDGSYRLNVQAGSYPPWSLSSGTETLGKYSRSVTIASVRREDTDGDGTLSAGDKIVTSGGAFDDPETKKITVTISWQSGKRTLTRSLTSYLTKWQS